MKTRLITLLTCMFFSIFSLNAQNSFTNEKNNTLKLFSEIDFTEENLQPGGSGNIGIVAIDVDNDLDKDIITVAPHETSLVWYENIFGNSDGGSYAAARIIDDDIDGQYIDAVDINNDNYPEILCSVPGNAGHIVLYTAHHDIDTIYWTRETVVPLFTGAHQVHLVDMDSDEDYDILAAGNITNRIMWWEKSDDEWIPHLIQKFYEGVQAVEHYDFNNDGFQDIISGKMSQSSGEVNLWISHYTDTLIYEKTVLDQNLFGAHWFDLADMNNDGLTDILAAGYFSQEIACWTRNHPDSTTFTRQTLVDHVGYPLHVAAADLDNDNDMDLLVPEHEGNNHKLLFYKNEGSSFIRNQIKSYYNASWQMIPFDFDNDSDIDFVSGAYYIPNPIISGDLCLFKNTLDPSGVSTPERSSKSPVINFPNPFRTNTQFEFNLYKKSEVKLEIFNSAGKSVKIVRSSKLTAGKHNIKWDGTNKNNRKLKSGTYFYSLKINDDLFSGSLILLD